jgi:hypothetical protein
MVTLLGRPISGFIPYVHIFSLLDRLCSSSPIITVVLSNLVELSFSFLAALELSEGFQIPFFYIINFTFTTVEKRKVNLHKNILKNRGSILI